MINENKTPSGSMKINKNVTRIKLFYLLNDIFVTPKK